ncbi:MAG: DUF1249 domain-containing protein [Gammaproteobacteria bacterium]|nr:DUF1249 domain-containing protein [Gammaproteobacteria bacterium]
MNILTRRSCRHPKNSTLVHEANYAKLLRAIPYIHLTQDQSIYLSNTKVHCIELKVLEVTRYTTMIIFTINYISQQKWLPQIDMTVRCYHDARVAEVINFQHHTRFDSRYKYPNPNMYHKNEKQQINLFLGEWLDYLLKNNNHFQQRSTQFNA